MSYWQTVLLVLSVELTIVLGAVVAVVAFRALKRRRLRREAAQAFVERFKHDAPERKQAVVGLLKQLGVFADADLERNATALVNSEKSLYARVLKIYTEQDRSSLASVDDEIQALASGYRNLASDLNKELLNRKSEGDEQLTADLRDRNRLLREENERLKDDLKQSMESVDRILDEYASMYSGGQKDSQESKDRSKQRIDEEIEKLEQLSNAKHGAA